MGAVNVSEMAARPSSVSVGGAASIPAPNVGAPITVEMTASNVDPTTTRAVKPAKVTAARKVTAPTMTASTRQSGIASEDYRSAQCDCYCECFDGSSKHGMHSHARPSSTLEPFFSSQSASPGERCQVLYGAPLVRGTLS